ncbi:alpha/beta fold hydrolase [Paenibacillus roseipurpureus]|uniref:Alpha/beta fold hydrolase n=1 Tax=Paenibacillus roseopurpureus TaxID=2918901 RepID=A0AA96RKM4_9BACL|nr:alpha/beta fold hydrolase [Paenibacillus sp. MBLB1832]WNR42217.1 alpha/beta fold hydrolase [Paenibacillus sp. MBLB1832]
MRKEHFIWIDSQDHPHYVYEWLPSDGTDVKGVVQIAHGMAETAARYERLAEVLTKRGYAVYAQDHLGHGLTAGSQDALGKFGKDCFHAMAANMGGITQHLRKRYPSDIPLFVLGHSMGSFLTQYYMGTYLKEHRDDVQGILLSGSNGKQGAALVAGIFVATLEAALRGDHYRSVLLTALTFGSYNTSFKPNRTAFDWLSRDEREVDAYIEDPACGVVFTSGFYRDFFKGLKEIHTPAYLQQIPKDVPIYIFSGEEDPVGERGEGVRRLIKAYERLGIKDVIYKLYPGGRHEMLNEINRDEVMADVANKLDAWVGS